MRVEHIGDATLYLGDCMDVFPKLGKVDAVITDPPYGARTHAGHDAKGDIRRELGYASLSDETCEILAEEFVRLCDGWIVWMTDHSCVPLIEESLRCLGRYVFAPLPFYQAGRSVRLTGDGPCSWTDWILVARTKAQSKWGTLPGGYIAGPGWNDKARMGGKPTLLMESLLQDYSKAGQTVLDPFMGAGTTGVAAARTGRKFIGCEIDEAAFELSCKRIREAHAQPALFNSYSKDSESDSKNQNGLLFDDSKPLISLENLAEWTGLEPATPGVTGRSQK
jgi:site-specific DNA-methyltransferase (adenine-specific)